MRQTHLLSLAGLCLVALLTACGSGSGSGSGGTASGSSISPRKSGSLNVLVVDELGAPIRAASVHITRDGTEVAQKLTDSRGEAAFASLPAESLVVSVYSNDHHQPTDRRIEVIPGMSTRAEVTLKPRSTATAVVLGTRKVGIGDDGRTLQFEADIAVLDQNGDALVSLSQADFVLDQWDCGWGGCINGPGGSEVGSWLVTSSQPFQFGLVPGAGRTPFAVGFLLDLGQGREGDEPGRSEALVEFLHGFGGNDRVLLAGYRVPHEGSAIYPSGEFVTDGRSLVPFVQQLMIGMEDPRTLADVVEPMLDYLQERSPALPTTLVVVGAAAAGCGGAWPTSCGALAERSRAAGIPITIMGSGGGAEDLSHLTGGAYFNVNFPAQYRTALRGLTAVLGGEIAFYRMRYTVRLDDASVVAPGNTLHTSVTVRLGEQHYVHAPIPLAL